MMNPRIQDISSITLILEVMHITRLLIFRYLFSCDGASTFDYRGGTCTAIARFRICLFICIVEITFDFMGWYMYHFDQNREI